MSGEWKTAVSSLILLALSGVVQPLQTNGFGVALANPGDVCTPSGCLPPKCPPSGCKPPQPVPPTPPSLFKQFIETAIPGGGTAIVQYSFWTLDSCNLFGVAGNFKTYDDPFELYPVVLADLQTTSTELGCPDLPPPGRFITVDSEPFSVPASGARILYPSKANLMVSVPGQP